MRQARAARVLGIRRRVLASALAMFVATWLLITMLLISGHDPALARPRAVSAASTPVTTTTTAATPVTTTTTAATPATTTTTAATTQSSSTSSSSPSALTSSQS